MVSGRAATLTLLVLGFAISGVVCVNENGLPRPANFPDAPDASYGATPALTDSTTNLPADCQWYGWANLLYNATVGAECLLILRMALTNATVNPPQSIAPYAYYTIQRLIDPANNQSYCYEGCFNLGNSPAPSPSGTPLAPPPVALSSPPSPTPIATPPLPATPPPTLLTPAGSPPATVPAASPPDASPPAASPPDASPPDASPPSSSSPADAPSVEPPTTSPPAPPGTTIVNLNGGSTIAPSTLLMCFVAGIAVMIVSLAGR